MVFVNWGYGQVGSRHGDKMPEIIHVEVERFVWAHRLRGFSRPLLGLMLWACGRAAPHVGGAVWWRKCLWHPGRRRRVWPLFFGSS